MYPNREFVVETLTEVARRAGMSCDSDHPEDIAIAMSTALENGAVVVEILNERRQLTTNATF